MFLISVDVLTSSIFSNTISKFLYPSEISNVYSSCKTTEKYIKSEGKFIYDKVCLHIQPHGHMIRDNHYGWCKEGRLHRDGDLPSVIYFDGSKQWYKKGKLHRDEDLPAIIYSTGCKAWYKKGKLHRDGDLPAVISDTGKRWYIRGNLHRDGDLPAVIATNGYQAWWMNGIFIK